jgi:hypothetical protein
VGPGYHGVGGMSGDTPENVARAQKHQSNPWTLSRIGHDIGSGINKFSETVVNKTGVGGQMNYAANSAASGFVSNYVGQQSAASGVNAAPLVKASRTAVMQGELAKQNSFIDPKTGNLQKKAIVKRGAVDAVSMAAGEGLGMAAGKYIVKPVVNKIAGSVKNSFASRPVVNAAENVVETVPVAPKQFEGRITTTNTKIPNSTEDLMSKEVLGKYLAKTKASKTQVTPVRKLGSDFRVEPSLNGPATIKSKLGDAEGYPRGYTPKQMKQVTDAEAQGRVSFGSDSTMKGGRLHAEHETALVKENIARSKYDPTTLRKTNADSGEEAPLDFKIGFKRDAQKDSTQAFYDSQNRFIALGPKNLSNNVPIHEIGHDIQYTEPHIMDLLSKAKEAGKKQPEGYRLQTEEMLSRGIKEGDAERFGDENWVPDPRGGTKQKISTYKHGAFVSEHTDDSRTQLFGKGYRAAKGPELTSEHPEIQESIQKAIVEAQSGRPSSPHGGNYGQVWRSTDYLKAAGIPIPESLIPPSRFSIFRDAINNRRNR